MYKIKQVLRLYVRGESKKQIVTLIRASPVTVRKYIQMFHGLQTTYEELEEKTDLELQMLFDSRYKCGDEPARFKEFQALIPSLVKQLSRRGVSAYSVWQQYRVEHLRGYGYAQFTKYINEYTNRTRLTMHIEHKAGDKMYIDFAGDKLHIVDEQTGELKPVQVFRTFKAIMKLAAKAGPERIINACKRAEGYGVYNYEILRQIIENNMDSLPVDEPLTEPTSTTQEQQKDFVRGKDY